ncbi:hypothetical protein [Methanomethylovorans sp.]|uniref:hypothetical protein n=1 Tax=Methanomethylovorans sp. TaxID=2758717 RepID=UPI00351BFAD4
MVKTDKTHPDNSVTKPTCECKKVTFERITLSDNSYQYKFNGYKLPRLYRIDKTGIYKRKKSNQLFDWQMVTLTHCIVSDFNEGEVKILYANESATIACEMWIDTSTAFSPGIATKLRRNGAVCPPADGGRLASYLRDCYKLRRQERAQHDTNMC